MVGEVTLTPIVYHNALAIGESKTYVFDIKSEIGTNIFHPDHCVSKEITAGLDVRVQVSQGSTIIHTENLCLPAVPLTRPDASREISFTIRGVTSGEVEIKIEVVGDNSMNLYASEAYTIIVGDGSGDGDGGDGGGSIEPEEPPEDEPDEDTEDRIFDLLESIPNILLLLIVLIIVREFADFAGD